MMIPDNIARNHILKAIQEIDREGIPKGRNAKKFKLVFDEKAYPPKYVISLANKYANGEELEPSDFGGGPETNTVLTELRFEIAETSSTAKDNTKSSRSESTETAQKEHFRDIIENIRKDMTGWVATVILQSGFCSLDAKFEADLNNSIITDNLKDILEAQGLSLTESATVKNEREGEWVIPSGKESYTVYKENERLFIYKHHNEDRLDALSKVVNTIIERSTGDGVILFPAGMIYTEDKAASTFYNKVQETLILVLKQTNDHVIVCTGVDSARDQIAIAVDKTGIIAKGRKFYASPGDSQIKLAPGVLSEEDGKSRIFELNGTRYYLCVCYDTYGLRHKNLYNPKVDVVLNLVHAFYPKGEGPSGEPYFAKHGFAGASKQWGCLVFGAAVFFNREIPPLWPTGVYWNLGDKSTTKWKYSDNPIKPAVTFEPITIEEGLALVRRYNLKSFEQYQNVD